MRRGPKGATIERETTTVAKTTWQFTREDLVKRLGLPDDAKIYMRVPGGADYSNMDLFVGEVPLVAEATEVRRPKKEGNS